MKVGIYPGSFDPVTFGHLDIIERSAKIVDELVVGVLNNSAKNSLFSLEERVSMIKEMTAHIPNVRVGCFEGLLVDYMKKINATIIIRGLRAVTDFEYELQIEQANGVQNPEIETVFLTSSLNYSYLSSTEEIYQSSYLNSSLIEFMPNTILPGKETVFMSSKMEQIIEEIEDYIDGCKPSPISRNKILVNREQLEELLSELRTKTPEEVKRYQKIISNKEAILADAQAKADQIIAQAQIQTNELVSEHQIMQQAYAQANEVVQIATKQAQEILDSATNEANNLRMSAMAYTDSQLKSIEDILTGSIETSKARYDSLISSLQQFEDVVAANRAELFPPEENGDEAAGAESSDNEAASDTSDDDIEITNISDSDEDAK